MFTPLLNLCVFLKSPPERNIITGLDSDAPLNLHISTGQDSVPDSNEEVESEERGRPRERVPIKNRRVVSSSEDDLPDLPPPRKQPPKKRSKKECPRCAALVINLPRHMREVHKMKPKVPMTDTGGYIIRMCAYPGCGRKICRLRQHLKSVHKMENEEQIKSVLNDSRPVCVEPSR